MIATFAMMNVNKAPDGDWIWYSEHYRMAASYSVSEYLSSKVGYVVTKWNEPTYYILAKTIYWATGGSLEALAIIITYLNYGMVGYSLYATYKFMNRHGQAAPAIILIIAATMIAINPVLVTHLIRQELAASMVILGYAFLIDFKRKAAVILALLAATTHQSALIFILILYIPFEFGRLRSQSSPVLKVAKVLYLCAIFGAGYVISTSSLGDIGQKNDGSVSSAVWISDLVLSLFFLLYCYFTRKDAYARSILLTICAFYVMMISLWNVPLAVLRMYFYFDFIRAVAVVQLSVGLLRQFGLASFRFFQVILLTAAIIYCQYRVLYSPFDFGGNFIKYLFYPLIT